MLESVVASTMLNGVSDVLHVSYEKLEEQYEQQTKRPNQISAPV